MAEYIEYHPLKFWLDPASIAEIVAHIQTYLVNNPINSTTEIETIIHDYLIAHPEIIGGVRSINGETGEVVLTADNIGAGETVTIKDVLDSLQDQISSINDIIEYDIPITITNYTGTRNYAILGLVNGNFVAGSDNTSVWIAVQGYDSDTYSGTRVYDSGKKTSPYNFTIENNTDVYYRVVFGLDSGSFTPEMNAGLYTNNVKGIDMAVSENSVSIDNLSVRIEALNTEVLSIMHGATTSYPSNTIGLFKKAYESGILYWECDVRPCLDGYVLCHDNDIYNHALSPSGQVIPQGTVLISNNTVETLKTYKFGIITNQQANGLVPGFQNATIPTLQEFLQFAKAMGAHPVIEIKFAPTAQQMADICSIIKTVGVLENTYILAYAYPQDVVTYACQNGIKNLSIIIDNGAATTGAVDAAYSYIQPYISDLHDVFFNPGVTNFLAASSDFSSYVASKGMRVCVWTLAENPSESTIRSLFDRGCTGYTTNKNNISRIVQSFYGF